MPTVPKTRPVTVVAYPYFSGSPIPQAVSVKQHRTNGLWQCSHTSDRGQSPELRTQNNSSPSHCSGSRATLTWNSGRVCSTPGTAAGQSTAVTSLRMEVTRAGTEWETYWGQKNDIKEENTARTLRNFQLWLDLSSQKKARAYYTVSIPTPAGTISAHCPQRAFCVAKYCDQLMLPSHRQGAIQLHLWSSERAFLTKSF